jgi:uncharacterized membrane protein
MFLMPPLYLLHPLAVHFAVALLLTGAIFKALSEWKKQGPTGTVSLWLLRLAFPATLLTATLGLLAAKTAPHVPAAWETMHDHKLLGLWTASFTVALWLVEEWAHREQKVWLIWLARALGLRLWF